MTQGRELTGKLAADAVHQNVTRVAKSTIQRFEALADLTGTVSDVLDEYGIRGAIGSSVLRPTIPGSRVIGTAITMRDEPMRRQPHLYATSHSSGRGEIEAHNQAQPGDVLVIQGVTGVSSMGGISASIGRRQGEIGAVVDGGIRDVTEQRAMGFPIWSRDISPVTGKWRIRTVEVNGPVTIQGVIVHAGDLVIADETGVCFVPAAIVERVLERAEQIVAGEVGRYQDIAAGLPVPQLARKVYPHTQQPPASVEL